MKSNKGTNLEKKIQELNNKNKKLFDKKSFFHFLSGSLLSGTTVLLNRMLFKIYMLYTPLFLQIIMIVLIPVLEYIVHKIVFGYSTLISKHAIVDLVLANIGASVILFLLSILFI